MTVFTDAFSSTFSAVLQIFLVAAVGALSARFKLLKPEQTRTLSAIAVRVFMPCLIFANVIKNFQPAQIWLWLALAASAVIMMGFGITVGAAIYRKQLPGGKNMLALAGIQNAGFLVLPLGSILYPESEPRFYLYCFLYFTGVNMMIWGVGKFLVSTEAHEKMSFRGLINPPFLTTTLTPILVLLRADAVIPSILVKSVAMLGQAAVPMAIFILGAMLGQVKLKMRPYYMDILKTAAVKFIVLPVVTIAVVWLLKLHETNLLLAYFFVLQSAAAPAINLMIQVSHYGGDQQKIGAMYLAHYLICILAMPLWLGLFNALTA